MSELRLLLRRLRGRPDLTVPAVLVLALALGTNILVFAVVDSVYLRPLPFRAPERVVMVWQSNAELQEMFGLDAFAQMNHSAPGFLDLTRRADQFEGLAAYRYGRPTVVVQRVPRQLRSMQVSTDFFGVLGVEPLVGSVPADAVEEPLAFLSHDLWRQSFAANGSVLGEPLPVDGMVYEIAGVLPPGFDLPPQMEAGVPWRTDVWTLVPGLLRTEDRSRRELYVIGRLREGVTTERAEAQLLGIARQTEEDHPDTDQGWSYWLQTRRDYLLEDVSAVLGLLYVAATLVVLIAAANLVGLLLANLTRRAGELEMLGALGAPPTRLRWQIIGEGVGLTLVGATGGLALAWAGVEILGAFFTDLLPRGDQVRVHPAAIAYGLSLAAFVGLGAGALAAPRSIQRGLAFGRTGSEGSKLGRFHRRARWLPFSVVLQTALSFVLLVGAGLLGHSLWRLASVDTGFAVEGAIVGDLALPPERYSPVEVERFVGELVERLSALPQIEAVGGVDHLPISGVASRTGARADGVSAAAESPVVVVGVVTPGYLEALGVPLREGRSIATRDIASSPPVAVINESAAEVLWPGRQAVGRMLELELGTPPAQVVGLVADHRTVSLSANAEPTVYLPLSQVGSRSMSLLLRSTAPLDVVEEHVRAAIHQLDPQQPISLRPLSDSVSKSVLRPTVLTFVAALLGAEALLLATIGLYGLLSYLVGCRRREMRIRLSLGASRRAISSLVLGSSIRMVAGGLALGFLGTLLLHRLIAAFLFEVRATDPGAHLLAALLLVSVAVLASLVPTYRATRLVISHVLNEE